ncbi:hypothetical protein IQ247_27145 [Plectonema cf. radiosum LEGE 06105]|uniref:Uncharacterized protein n=1 Tax=Plectonema cf. radiosum LEGE 06105 TaxID=945769 RepID=A0A8J7JX39_9CYAN|nr:hypothetical protein [Plectonema radiosum]MBE9216295.1 hypothetical protein [Plectonema cf. radiosum LEGE 06105]
MREIKDNSLQYYLLHHSAVLFGTSLISRFIKLLVALNLPSPLGLLSISSFGLIFLIIWAFWCYQNWHDSWSLIERMYRYGMVGTIVIGLMVGFI